MCDTCISFSQLLISCEVRLSNESSKAQSLKCSELDVILNYIQTWTQRQCMCCYRELKTFEKFYVLTQSIVCVSVFQLKELYQEIEKAPKKLEVKESPSSETIKVSDKENEAAQTSESKGDEPSKDEDVWTSQDREKLFHILSKMFLLNFPLYLACKHSGLSRLDDLSAQEISGLNYFCDLHDTEIPAYLLRNVTLFCKSGGMCTILEIFEKATLDNIQLTLAHALVGIVGNVKLWLNYRAMSQLFMPIRTKALSFLCNLEDKELRLPVVKTMADFLWSSTKEPLETPTLAFDAEGLALAFKYFNSSTLTMRLAGVAQINGHISSYNELCAADAAPDGDTAGQQLAQTLIDNNIIHHLFGPNLHVEVIKQSHLILKFLAMEGKITAEHMELVWQAAQLKHCGRQVYDLLPGFIRALSAKPCLHLYSLLCALPPNQHTEQSLYLASALLRVMWTRGPPPPPASSSSVSMDHTNSDEDPCEELSTSNEETGPTPRKQTKHQPAASGNSEWLAETEELLKREAGAIVPKICNKRSKPSGRTSGSSCELRRPRKKKLYRKRDLRKSLPYIGREMAAQLGDMVESVSEAEDESSASDSANVPAHTHAANYRLVELRLLDDGASSTSGMSVHSEKNIADLDEDDSACEEELARLAAEAACMGRYSPPRELCEPGNTLLWDLLQDGTVEQLGEGLALEAEKALCALLCFSTDKFIRIKFIEGCLDNLSNHRTVAVSLRLLPKLFTSFQQIRGMEMNQQQVIMWAERERGMMRLFMEDFEEYASKCNGPATHQRVTEVSVRLQFLTAIFSATRPDHFRLNVEQTERLWWCAHACDCADCLYSWLLSHAECGALTQRALQYLYCDKMSSLPPESFSVMALSLYQQLCHLARAALGPKASLPMDHMWNIALRANSTDVSMGAIQYLNSYYIGQQLQQEQAFVSKCMQHLSAAAARLVPQDAESDKTESTKESSEPPDIIYGTMSQDAALQCIQRALLLLRTHLDTFKRRYAYQLRRWALARGSADSWQGTGSLRIALQPAGSGQRTIVRLAHHDLIAHLRAHIHAWWEKQTSEDGMAPHEEGPLRLITQGQELTVEYDERTLYDMGFKDNQLVFVSVGVGGSNRSEGGGAWAEWATARRNELPTFLLLDPDYFGQLENLMCTLGQMGNSPEVPHTKAQLLSRRVWDILQAVPLNPTLLEAFQNPNEADLSKLLDPSSPQKLMYALHIVDKLSSGNGETPPKDGWSDNFIRCAGLRHLYDIVMSGVLQQDSDCEWRQDCLALLLQLICRIGTLPNSQPNTPPVLHESFQNLLNNEQTIDRMISILCDASTPKDPSAYKTGFWGRAQVVGHALRVCVWWAGSTKASQLAWALRRAAPRLLLDDADPNVRREAGNALYRVCAGEPEAAAALLQHLLQHLHRAIEMRPTAATQQCEEGKEPYGPACRDYFWLVCRLVDCLPEQYFKEEANSLESVCETLITGVQAREPEKRGAAETDDSLAGPLALLTHLLKHPLPYKTSEKGQRALLTVFGFLFDVADSVDSTLPKCKSQKSRAAAYDLLVEMVKGAPENYMILYEKLMEHHKPGRAWTSIWDYWPAEEGRAPCGRVGLSNLGATCYLAACVQHLYMMPEARRAVLQADPAKSRHAPALAELQTMFAHLCESERKSYSPRNFCKVYQMDHQPLNTGEQKDMAEFFIDLVSKLEEMTPELKTLVKTLFCGILSNNVVSLDCGHVSRTLEEFYTVRCQVADMRNLQQSLDEVTVKDTLEGDNMYTCDRCNSKVRAEKRACFKKLPRILCFNTMRYTFNMVTMLKEKVNTHFSFPMRLDMAGYVEKHLMPAQYMEEKRKEKEQEGQSADLSPTEDIESEENYEYELIGVTVHTGTADGGHYYSFIRDREKGQDRWLLFNDAEVKPFDPSLIANECFGGEMTSKTYDSVTDKFMDFSFEKTNSAYMLFYELSPKIKEDNAQACTSGVKDDSVEESVSEESEDVILTEELRDLIWKDNMQFLHDKNIFQHAYFTFMGQMCSYVPQSIVSLRPDVTELAARLSTSFFIETFIHAKEKPTMVSWVELVTKQFNASQTASEWFLGYMADDPWWPLQVLIKCPNQMVRQMFQRLCMHVIQRLRSSHCALYLEPADGDCDELGKSSCVTRFIRMLLSLMDSGARSHLRHLTEYFSLLYEFSKMGEVESTFLLKTSAISSMVNFYLGHTPDSNSSGWSSDESGSDKLRPGALDKMVALVASLVEKARDELSAKDADSLMQDKEYPFIYQQTRDCLNLQQTRNLIFALCRWSELVGTEVVDVLIQGICKHPDSCAPLFKLLTLLVEGTLNSNGLPDFTSLVLAQLPKLWDSAAHHALEWLALQVPRNKEAAAWVLRTASSWTERLLLAPTAPRTRAAAALLLVALVPSAHFRQGYARLLRPTQPHRLPDDAHVTLHQVYTMLLEKLKVAKKYTDIGSHGTMKLTVYFGVMTYCLVSRIEKLMFGQYFRDLWDIYHPGISEPSAAIHPNKQALLSFWYAVSQDCPENVQIALSHQPLTKHIAFNYILADHEDGEVIAYNRVMLPAYYALLRLFANRSSSFANILAHHQNIHWAYRNIAPHSHLYPDACDELLRLARVLITQPSEAGPSGGPSSPKEPAETSQTEESKESTSNQETKDLAAFRRSTLAAYLQGLNGRTCWTTFLSAIRTLVENDEDRLFVVYNGGLQMAFEAFQGLHAAYASSGGGGARALRSCMCCAARLCAALRTHRQPAEARARLLACKEWAETSRRLLSLVGSGNGAGGVRGAAVRLLRQLIKIGGGGVAPGLASLLLQQHKIKEEDWGRRHSSIVSVLWKVGVESGSVTEKLVVLTALCRLPARAWRHVVDKQQQSKYEEMFVECPLMSDYIDSVMTDERNTLTNDDIFNFIMHFYPKLESCKPFATFEEATSLLEESRTRRDQLTSVRSMLILLSRQDALPCKKDKDVTDAEEKSETQCEEKKPENESAETVAEKPTKKSAVLKIIGEYINKLETKPVEQAESEEPLEPTHNSTDSDSGSACSGSEHSGSVPERNASPCTVLRTALTKLKNALGSEPA